MNTLTNVLDMIMITFISTFTAASLIMRLVQP